MKPRLLAVDLDGTLLRRDHSIDPRDVEAIAGLRARGVIVTIITGRLRDGALPAARELGLDSPIGCAEGSHVFDLATGRDLVHQPYAAAHADEIGDLLDVSALSTFTFRADGIDFAERAERFVPYVRTWAPSLRAHAGRLPWDDATLGAVAIGPADDVTAAAAALRALPHAPFVVQFPVMPSPGMHAVLTRAGGTDKGTALAAICAHAGCSTAEAVTVGDWINDIAMLRAAGRSFVMAGAPPEVQAAATDHLTTPTSAGGGIAELIARVWGV